MAGKTTGSNDRLKILLLRPDHIGDLILTTPALHAVRQALPNAHIAILVGSWSAAVLDGNPNLDEIIVCDFPWIGQSSHTSWKTLLKTLREIRGRNFDHILNFRVAAKAASFSRLCKGKQRWGFDVAKSRWAWTQTVSYSTDRHVVDNYHDLVNALITSIDPNTLQTQPTFQIFPTPEDENHVDQLLKDTEPPVVLGAVSRRPEKSWQPDRWAKVADHIAEQGFPIMFSGAPSESEEIETVQSQMNHPSVNLAGQCSLIQFAALLKKSHCIVTLDSSAVHFATAVQTPTVALYGPTSSRHWGPYPNGQPFVVVEPPSHIPQNARAMEWIQVHHVTEAFDQLQHL